MTENPRICDYEGSTYRTDFWEGRGRSYEDTVERRVLQRMLPASGTRLLELGAGFGRLTGEYAMFETVVLLDYSFSQLVYAREQLGDDGYIYVAADAYRLPFQPGVFDAATMIRVIHHFERVPDVLQSIQRTLTPQATFVLEFANKRNLKALLRHAIGRQAWNPRDRDPVEFVELNFNFHPAYIAQALQDAGFQTRQRVPVSFFRMGALKRTLPSGMLAGLDGIMQRSGWLVAPSIFTQNTLQSANPDHRALTGEAIFACPATGDALQREGDTLVSAAGRRYAIREGIYDFKQEV